MSAHLDPAETFSASLTSSIICEACGSLDNTVTDSRDYLLGKRRRRRCNVCLARWGTVEVRTTLYNAMVDYIRESHRIVADLKGVFNQSDRLAVSGTLALLERAKVNDPLIKDEEASWQNPET